MDGQFRVVVVGGGFAGLTTALALAHKRSSVSVVLVEPQEHFLFTPLLYELLSGELRTWQAAPKLEHLLAGRGVAWLQDRVTSINRQTRCLTTSSGRELSFDRLALACGGVLQSFGVAGVTDHAIGFRTMTDLRRLQHLVQRLQTQTHPLQRLAIVGAGASGVELACKLADLLAGHALIELIEQGDDILAGSREFNRQQALAALQQRDVLVRCQSRVQMVAADHLTLLVQGQTETLPCAGVLWTAGLAVAPPLLLPSVPADPQGRLICQANLRLAEEEAIFAAGDVAAVPDKKKQQTLPATAQVAMQQAPVLAHNILASLDGEPLQDFHWNDLGEMLSLGRGQAAITAKGFTMAGPTAAKLREAVYLARMPGAGHRLAAAVGWLGEHLKP
ncbi:MAG: FAD-dependent oxidoreductase [Synechococcus sp. SB0673_bin_10]|nr:FAD-dependent oxidoreductase [Synechococcus sp. SB0665_bin_28]MYF19956.1 FAD-dependent oxidoreductase [Synechococcus sp. SB0677_bin_5]MYG63226.1 FAD-dependent oxidoreductase [Synechococcus sp. SB0675_bin_7]MYI71587.1 FAD-dependent oxidoreductase [Synechococcus sp. SB0673_bin_10]MYK84903.1 FAD-dependent oxidoreductase [Synechococcus sp. SB0669_bin_7]